MNFSIRDLYDRLTPDEIENPFLAAVLAVGRWAMVFYLQLQRDQAFVRAAQMAYQTLVALVPLLLLIFGVLGATGLVDTDRQKLESLIFETFIADIPQVRDFIMRGIGDLDLTALGIIGVAGLIIFAGRLFLMVEASYNHIFGTKVTRGWGYRLLNFWFSVTVVPVVLSIGFLSTIELASDWGLGNVIRQVLEPAVMFGILLAALKLFPTVPVRWGPAALGATVSSVGIWGARGLFRLYLLWFKADDPLIVVYGTVGLIPVFLLWLYLVWVIVLLGVEVAYVFQNFHSLWEVERANLEGRDGPLRGPRLHTALELLAWVGWHFEEGRGPIAIDAVAKRVGLSRREVEPVLELLMDAGFVVGTPQGWTLARPAQAVDLGEVIEAWRKGTSPDRRSNLATRAEGEVGRALERALPPTLADAIDRWVRPEVAEQESGLREVR